jgi:hypothetical protein
MADLTIASLDWPYENIWQAQIIVGARAYSNVQLAPVVASPHTPSFVA